MDDAETFIDIRGFDARGFLEGDALSISRENGAVDAMGLRILGHVVVIEIANQAGKHRYQMSPSIASDIGKRLIEFADKPPE